MKIQQRPSSLLLLLVPCLHFTTSALLSSEEVVALAEGKQIGPPPELPNQGSKPVVNGLGTKDAPIDGKDGRPHLGPFVETGAERDRKKAKEIGSDDAKVEKPIPSSLPDSEMPETNNGVMDDPNRTGPKEGTRGTEGGISEKNRDSKQSQSDAAKGEKKPDPPKEAPPLPHSEQESLNQKAPKDKDKDDGKKSKEISAEDIDKSKELGGLEVSIIE